MADTRSAQPWHPDPSWADPLIALVALLVLLLGSVSLRHRLAPPAAPQRVGLQGRILELRAAANHLLPRQAVSTPSSTLKAPWDRAVGAVLAAEEGRLEEGMALALQGECPAGAGPSFRRCWLRAYVDPEVEPSLEDRAQTRRALGNGYAAHLLEARLLEDAGTDATAERAAARSWGLSRLIFLACFGAFLALALPGGLVLAVLLAARRRAPRPFAPPACAMSGRALLLVFLGWLLALLLSGTVASALLALVPGLRFLALPLAYAFHAGLGLFFLCRAEGLPLRQLATRLAPGAHGRSLAWGVAFLGLAVTAVVAVALLSGPLLRPSQSPQRELVELVTSLGGLKTMLPVVFTLAILAPCFEETMFRGCLLPWLGSRIGWAWALVASSLCFGAMHLQPAGLPTLSTLGFVLGLAFLRTRNLLTSILVHGLWNGTVFALLRVILA